MKTNTNSRRSETKFTRPGSLGLSLTLAAAAALGAAQQSQADTRTWDGDTSVTWTAADNWDTGAPANDLTTDIANFNLGTYGGNPVFAPTAPASQKINGITIGGSNGAMTITTATSKLVVGSGGITVASGAGAFTLGASTTTGASLGADQTWSNNSSSLMTIGSLGNNNTGAYTLTLAGSGTGGYKFSSAISNGSATNTTTVVVDYTSGTVQLRGGTAGNFSGGLRIKQGGQVIVGQTDMLGLGTVTMGYGGGSSAVSIMTDILRRNDMESISP